LLRDATGFEAEGPTCNVYFYDVYHHLWSPLVRTTDAH
jgi:hypothetical protein